MGDEPQPRRLTYAESTALRSKILMKESFFADQEVGVGLRKTGRHGYCGTQGCGGRIGRVWSMPSNIDIDDTLAQSRAATAPCSPMSRSGSSPCISPAHRDPEERERMAGLM